MEKVLKCTRICGELLILTIRKSLFVRKNCKLVFNSQIEVAENWQ